MSKKQESKGWSFNLDKAPNKENLKDPLGFKSSINDVVVRNSGKKNVTQTEVLENKAWEFAKSPSKQIFVTLFMFYMTGTGLSIWTIMITCAFVMNPLKSIFGVNQAFVPFENKQINLLLPKLTYVFFNAVMLAGALYKFSIMGIIPVAPIDWVGLISSKVPIEHSQVVVFN
ncbi:UNKNOWN [Stylonychia lemnae]|uniref:ER membrane protein complex subunit 4 n=1 Tax=Stylonychia lemnae TaxID=5949 RepID=A0A078ALR8_STYLE|nr:UNKNOWN [Stylonychia lemnae]|eukprot:CDW82357.1 UNKNOWN [Stylonychia lemnae]